VGDVAAPDQGAHRGADDDVGRDAARLERVNDANMGKTARRAAAENESDRGPAGFGLNGGGSNVYDSHPVLDFFLAAAIAPLRPSMIGEVEDSNKLPASLW
jgi:hypothetical protein